MKRRLCTVLTLLLIATFGTAGCSHFGRRAASQNRPIAFALSVTVNRVLQPTPVQWAAIQAKMAQVLGAQGHVLVTDLSLADRILRIDFTPDPNDPENSGQLTVLGTRDNPLHIAANTSYGGFPTSFGYQGSFRNALWGNSGTFGNYYSWSDSFYDGYSYGSGNLNPVCPPVVNQPSRPPHRPHPSERDCPPSENYIRTLPQRPPGEFATNHHPSDHPRSAPSHPRRWRGGDDDTSSPPQRTFTRSESTRSESTRSRPERSHSRSHSYSSPSFSRSDSGSYSSPSYSPSSYSSPDSFSSGGSSSFSGSSGGGSSFVEAGGASGAHTPTNESAN